VDGVPKPILHLGVAVRGGDAMKGGRTGVFQDADSEDAVGLEMAFRNKAAFLTAEAFWQTDRVQNPVPAPDLRSAGWHVQGGYMVLARRLELDFRYAEVDPNRDVTSDRSTELRGGANYYWKGHNLKLQTDVGRLTFDLNSPARASASRLPAAANRKLADMQYRAQLQLAF
jgi:hypothetical protein